MDAIACDLRDAEPNVSTIDGLARLQLALRRRGERVCLTNVPAELCELLRLCGLDEAFDEVVPADPD